MPHSAESEVYVLGAVLAAPETYDEISDLLTPEAFYQPRHGAIWAAMSSLHDAGIPIEPTSVWQHWERQAGRQADAVHIAYLVDAVGSAAAARHHAQRVHDLGRLRAFIVLSRRAVDAVCADPDPASAAATLDAYEGELLALRRGDGGDSGPRRLSEIAPEVWSAYQERASSGAAGRTVGLATGYRDLDRITLGLHPGTLVILAARPSMGKSAMAAAIARHVAQTTGRPAVIYSLEMAGTALYERLLCDRASVRGDRWRSGIPLPPRDNDRLVQAMSDLQALPLWIDDAGSLSLADLVARTRRLRHREDDLALVVVDYLQLLVGVTARGKSREREVAEISRDLKALAKRLNCVVVAVSQLNREVERGG
jgi:replicative DNA helicase